MTDKETVTILPDGSAFFTASLPLPKTHWLYADRVYEEGAEDPIELGRPILPNDMRDAVESAIRYAIRSTTNCGKEPDFDPDALVQNAAYALCGSAIAPSHCEWQGLTDDEIWDADEIMAANSECGASFETLRELVHAISDKLKEKNT